MHSSGTHFGGTLHPFCDEVPALVVTVLHGDLGQTFCRGQVLQTIASRRSSQSWSAAAAHAGEIAV